MAPNMSDTISSISLLHYDYSDEYLSGYDSDSSMASTNYTPNKQGATGVWHRTRDNLQADLHNRTLRDVSVEDFVKHVYGFTEKDTEYITSKAWTLDYQSLAEYNLVLRKGLPETALYSPFKTIMDGLFQKFSDDGYALDINLASPCSEQLKSTGTPRKPGGLFMFKSHKDSDKVSWSLSKAFLEFQIRPSEQRLRKEARGVPRPIDTIRERTTLAAANVGVIASTPDLAPSTPLKAPSGYKRRSADVLGTEEQGPSKRPKQMTRKEAQGAGYALEMMAAACRRWATGFVIKDKTVWVHYYDRAGAIFTEEFDFSKDPHKLAMVALALAKCDVVQAGFEPLISPSPDSPLSAPLVSLDGAFLHLPVRDDDAGATYVKGFENDLYSHFEISGNPLYIYQGLNGRGSLVLPGRPIQAVKGSGTQPEQVAADTPGANNSTKDSGGMGIVHGTTTSGESPPQVPMVVKLSWPLSTRPSLEAELIHDLRDKLGRMRPHLPKVHFAMVLKGTSIQLPGDLFRSMTTAHNLEQRYLTLMIVEQYNHLWEVPTCDDFLDVYLDIVECHHAAMKTGNILHRDISEKNLLWQQKSRCVGVLNDWDLSSTVAQLRAHTKHPTGTGPFMALDLLIGAEPPSHLYRHDLESLFYVFVWAAVNFTLDKEKPFVKEPNSAILKWAGSYADAYEAKSSFLTKPRPVFSGIQSAFEPLRYCLDGLWSLFHKAFENSVKLENQLEKAKTASTGRRTRKRRNVDMIYDEEFPPVEPSPHSSPHSENSVEVNPPTVDEVTIDFETMGGCLTFEKFLAALGEQPRQYKS
ncbi:hypothetical protein PLEOSDRAFT_1108228 [Pleurotus ostreatus PC15]|uniref:Fungal-type protein kinase domain-containing protein n=1 Tax=Pleurotus ostreatus (strain PC15) TaxID=1137138 RepID=A0A067NI00_PLEO1|nr:hypothetical protein PLEOSDRAFT_1108228 [Pleurotus ostreatus PC15]